MLDDWMLPSGFSFFHEWSPSIQAGLQAVIGLTAPLTETQSPLPVNQYLLSSLLAPHTASHLSSYRRHLQMSPSSFKSQLGSTFHPNLIFLSFGLKSFNDGTAREVHMPPHGVRGYTYAWPGSACLTIKNCTQLCTHSTSVLRLLIR